MELPRFILVRVLALILAASAWLLTAGEPALGQTCNREDFEQAVSIASGTLRDMSNRNTPVFQEKLRTLKDKRGWTNEQFVKAAAPLVADERITEFDQKSSDYLMKINNLGGEGANSPALDCKLLDTLKATMAELVDTQTQKWTYMFSRLDAELAK